MTTSSELAYKSLAEQLTDALLERIDEDGLKPGDKLPSTATLVETYGVSRQVVREALKKLEGQGVIEMSGGRSAVIRPVSGDILKSFFHRAVSYEQKDSLEILEVRYGIEVQSARLAAQRRTEEQAAGLEALLLEMRRAIDDADAYAELDVQFHLLIAQATQNSLIYYLVSGIRDALRDVMREGLRYRLNRAERELVLVAHTQIVKKIVAADAEGAAKAMAFHFDDAIRAIFE